MVFQYIPLITAFVGSSIAAVWDLKTTEVPDQIPCIMIAIALLFYGIQSYQEWSYWPILNSVIAGSSLLGFGLLMYYLGQWGGADAEILATIGFLLPQTPLKTQLFFPFPLSYLINVFIVGAFYMIIYAVVLASINKKIIFEFSKEIKGSSKVLLLGSVGLFLLFFVLNWYLSRYFQLEFSLPFILSNSILPLVLTVSLFIVWRFARVVENVGFKKRVPVSNLKAGDVPMEFKQFRGITEKELSKIKKSGKRFVWIKEGVRFAPAFVLALIFTLYFGDVILLVRFLL